jgi:hypothetical protein
MASLAQLMIFSGRRDPEFALDDGVVGDLATRLASVLEVTPSGPPPEGGLGYRGFRVSNTDGDPRLPHEFEVFRGIVTETSAGEARHWADSGDVESFLIGQARAAGLGELLDAAGIGGGVG